MAEPAVKDAEDGGDSAGATDAPDSEVVEDGDEEVQMVQTDVASTGADPEGFFDDVEKDSENTSTDTDSLFDGVEGEEDDEDESSEAKETRSSGLADDINNGCARLAVIGLDDEWQTDDGKTREKDDLKDEFKETFEAFRLGHYGAEVVEKYLLVETDDIHPVWGLVGAMLICAAVVVYRRPDGDQLVSTTKTNLGQFDLSKIKKD